MFHVRFNGTTPCEPSLQDSVRAALGDANRSVEKAFEYANNEAINAAHLGELNALLEESPETARVIELLRKVGL